MKSEKLEFSSVLYYFCDSIYKNRSGLSENFLSIVRKMGFDDISRVDIIENVYINGLLKHRHRSIPLEKVEEELKKRVFDDDTGCISISNSGRGKKARWQIGWFLSTVTPLGRKKTFDHVDITCDGEILSDRTKQEKFIGMFCALADLLNAFYGRIEDISTAISVMDRTKERCFSDEYLQSIYWGNYFGKKICEDLGQEKLERLPVAHKEFTEAGFFFTLTDDIKDSATFPDWRLRKKVYKQLAPSRKCRLSDFKCADGQNEPET